MLDHRRCLHTALIYLVEGEICAKGDAISLPFLGVDGGVITHRNIDINFAIRKSKIEVEYVCA